MSYESAPTSYPEALEWCRRIARVTNSLLQGKSNNTGTVTLTASAGTTVVSLAAGRLGNSTVIVFDPTTANAASEQAAGTMYVSSRDVTNAQFTITHANAVSTDRTFRYALIG